MSYRMRSIVVTVLAAVAALATTSGASALEFGRCKGKVGREFRCGSLEVPLDYGDAASSTLKLEVRKLRPPGKLRGTIVFLSGGPGQAGIGDPEYTWYLSSLMPRWQIVELDQRGTGKGALKCPSVDDLSLDVVDIAPAQITNAFDACAQRLGTGRRFYTSIDSARDIERLRTQLGLGRIAIGGVSYGTYVSQVYARLFPAAVDRMLLDSVVGPRGVELISPLDLAGARRVVAAQCTGKRCAGVTSDLGADIARLQELIATAPLVGRLVNFSGRSRPATIGGPDGSSNLLDIYAAGDLDPFSRAQYPAAVLAAIDGDASPLLRLRKASEFRTKPSELSAALYAATSCAENVFPWAGSESLAARRVRLDEAVEAQPAATFVPWGSGFVNSYAASCIGWPESPFSGTPVQPLPDVPTLLLVGAQDVRTPIEDAQAVADLLPQAKLVRVPNTGHSVIGNAGCVELAVARFMRARQVGSPCRREPAFAFGLGPVPESISDLRPTGHQRGRIGRTISAVRLSILDAAVAAEMFLDDRRFPGLRRGYGRLDGITARLHRYSYVEGVEVTGGLGERTGKLKVRGRSAASGRLEIRDGRFAGRLGGRRVKFRG